MANHSLEFGFYPQPLHITAGPVTVEQLSELDRTVKDVLASENVENGWFYAPPRQFRDIVSGTTLASPYAPRVFRLPKTHKMEHATAASKEQLDFHLWALSFFTGMRLTATEAGFLDATPLKPGALVDFVLTGSSLTRAVELAEAFWSNNVNKPRQAQRFAAAVHALFLGQSPRNLQFESFIYLYMALDACFALCKELRQPLREPNHANRIAWMCGLYGMTPPVWADPATSGGKRTEVSVIRNDAVHEALFVGEPLGFALHGAATDLDLTLQMQALTCRLLVALIGGDKADYVRTPVDTRQREGLDLGSS